MILYQDKLSTYTGNTKNFLYTSYIFKSLNKKIFSNVYKSPYKKSTLNVIRNTV